jgi:hypothetical protein
MGERLRISAVEVSLIHLVGSLGLVPEPRRIARYSQGVKHFLRPTGIDSGTSNWDGDQVRPSA